ncbi:MAG: hypothetical protein R2751_19510 [Bacteroidales bacterium]
MANTRAIVRDCDWLKIAARFCDDLEVSDRGRVYDDWFLPAIYQLDRLHTRKDAVGNLDGEYYWSSTSDYESGAAVINFIDGRHHGANRNIPQAAGPIAIGIFVRPVRAL